MTYCVPHKVSTEEYAGRHQEAATPRFFGPVGDILSNIPIGITLQLSNVPHHANPALSPPSLPHSPSSPPYGSKFHSPPRVGTSLSRPPSLFLGSSPFTSLANGPPGPLSPFLPPTTLDSPFSPSEGIFSPLHSALGLPVNSLTPGVVSSPYHTSGHGPVTLLDKKVGLGATLHDSDGLRHPHVPSAGLPVHGSHQPLHSRLLRLCYHVSCTTLARYCKRQLLAPPGASINCGVFEVCCGLETYQGAFSSTFNSFSNTAGTCGVSNSDGVNGRINHPLQEEGDAEFGEYPWQAAVLKKEGFDNVYICAGTLIDERHILTAAHCVKGYEASELRIRLGEWDVNRDTEFYPYYESDVNAVSQPRLTRQPY
ncbi:Phenoloxidase-activating factor 2-like 3 [Homarus americanus]|uniref:Phenoloxidase-activating factor 2-like 3 n=1 Tax=Homarus americanus TaxID=6706 RepID=A0A8J5N2Z7_HOMAM|nr:Phenoloxidase-activating factor 2-like 3 [Homarus americanus]